MDDAITEAGEEELGVGIGGDEVVEPASGFGLTETELVCAELLPVVVICEETPDSGIVLDGDTDVVDEGPGGTSTSSVGTTFIGVTIHPGGASPLKTA